MKFVFIIFRAVIKNMARALLGYALAALVLVGCGKEYSRQNDLEPKHRVVGVTASGVQYDGIAYLDGRVSFNAFPNDSTQLWGYYDPNTRDWIGIRTHHPSGEVDGLHLPRDSTDIGNLEECRKQALSGRSADLLF